jgi:uncharacterized repeat protein (TIGR03803 family)
MILKSTTFARQLGILLLALAIIVPCSVAAPPTLTTLYNFSDLGDGGFPEAGLVMSTAGAFYGTTSGGAMGWGTVFELIPSNGGATYTQKTLYSFTGGADGAQPVADLVLGKNNVIYGTTYGGGALGYGTVFQVAPTQGGVWTEKVLYSFKGGNDGAYPAGGLVLNSSGVLYGTTYGGGTTGLGAVFQLAPAAGGVWTETTLYSFLGATDGAYPIADLTLNSAGILYGTTSQGGSITNSGGTYSNWGIVFQLAPAGGGVWNETILYTFTGGADGGTPESALILGPSNVLYGSTFWGGTGTCPVSGYPQGCGTVFQLAPPTAGGAWTESILYSFTGRSPDGAHPYKNMAFNSNGIFGTTYAGGAQIDICFPEGYPGCGTMFKLKSPSAPGGAWTKSNLIVFVGDNGGAPTGLILNKGGSAFGTTVMGGISLGYGTAYIMKP